MVKLSRAGDTPGDTLAPHFHVGLSLKKVRTLSNNLRFLALPKKQSPDLSGRSTAPLFYSLPFNDRRKPLHQHPHSPNNRQNPHPPHHIFRLRQQFLHRNKNRNDPNHHRIHHPQRQKNQCRPKAARHAAYPALNPALPSVPSAHHPAIRTRKRPSTPRQRPPFPRRKLQNPRPQNRRCRQIRHRPAHRIPPHRRHPQDHARQINPHSRRAPHKKISRGHQPHHSPRPTMPLEHRHRRRQHHRHHHCHPHSHEHRPRTCPALPRHAHPHHRHCPAPAHLHSPRHRMAKIERDPRAYRKDRSRHRVKPRIARFIRHQRPVLKDSPSPFPLQSYNMF
jgi:hypothetical protein